MSWQAGYAGQLDELTRGKVWRLGKHFWTLLDTNLELELVGVTVPPGIYYLGITRPETGPGWNLALIEAARARRLRLDAVDIADAPVGRTVPLTFSEANPETPRLAIRFTFERSDPGIPYERGYRAEMVLEIALGHLRLTAPVAVRTPAGPPPPPDYHWVNYEPHPKDMAVWVSGAELEGRRGTRLFYWSRNAQRSKGEIFIGYGPAVWSAEVEQGMAALKGGLTWRLGSGFWTTFDTSLPLALGGVNLAAGSYYLGVQRSADGERWSLAILDPETVRSRRIDAYETHLRPMPVARKVPLAFERRVDHANELTMRLDAHGTDPRAASLEILFGDYRLSASILLSDPPALAPELADPSP